MEIHINTQEVDGVTMSGKEGEYNYVELDLPSGTLWATYNVGATKPTEYGDYFAWGETKPKEHYSWHNYKWSTEEDDDDGYDYQITITKYRTKIYGGNGKALEKEDDAATANWGSDWRMPTIKEQQELLECCDWEWVEDFKGSGVNGRLGTSKINGATIFLPAAGLRDSNVSSASNAGYYWSSSIDECDEDVAYSLDFSVGGISHKRTYRRHEMLWWKPYRCYGQSVRAVFKKQIDTITVSGKEGKYTYVDLDLPSGTKWATCNVGASQPTDRGYYFAWGETKPKEDNCKETFFGKVTKYNNTSNYYGIVDNKEVLDAEDDAATANWGSAWRMPTLEEIEELLECCEWKFVLYFNGSGYLGISKTNGATIFLPNAGSLVFAYTRNARDGYWSSSLSEDSPLKAYYLSIFNGLDDDYRYLSKSVRAVLRSTSETPIQKNDIVTVSGKEGEYTYVDLGLKSGTKWATCNVGANSPAEYGDYFTWGETEPKEDYSEIGSRTNYWFDSYYDMDYFEGIVLEAACDAATANWGSAWRMPTRGEMEELVEGCDWKWVKNFNYSGVNGQLGTSKANGATIFLPAAGIRSPNINYACRRGHYWSSSLFAFSPYSVWSLCFNVGNVDWEYNYRYSGLSVRAVFKPTEKYECLL